MTSPDRRRFLKFSASALAAGAVPASIAKALTLPAIGRHGDLRDVEHVVILMQENRSFDHYFGRLNGVRGFADPHPVNLASGKSVWHQPNPKGGELLPFHPDVDDLGLAFLADLPHGWNDTHSAFNHGRYDGWIGAKGTTSMAYLERADIPFHYALADAFTICDAYHCSILSSTDPNRYYMWTGYVGNDGNGGGPVIDNAEKGYGWTTYPERLEAAGVSWKVYQDAGTGLDAAGSWGYAGDPYIGNYGDNALLYFNQYRNAAADSPLYQKARTGTEIAERGTLFDQLRADVRNGTLPQVSWIAAPEAYCEHPNWPANYGAWYIDQVIDALTSNPEVWGRTALFITYDENDGFFDHVVPPFPAASAAQGQSTVSTQGEIYTPSAASSYVAGPYGLGVRVPMLVVSPWSRGGWVCSETFDHTSILRFLEARFGVREDNISPWRRAVCGDLTRAFDFRQRNPRVPRLPSTRAYLPPDRERHDSYYPVPPSTQSLPKQEKGYRLARALPYVLAVNGNADLASGRYWLDFINAGDAGACFHVTAGNRNDGPWTYTVEADKALTDYWTSSYSGGSYDLAVHAPNGFLRAFSGRQPVAGQIHAQPEVEGEQGEHGDALVLTLRNDGKVPCVLTVRSNLGRGLARSFALKPGATAQWRWPTLLEANWYDLSVTSDSDPTWLRRLAGHVENGRPSLTDPALGR